MASIHWKALEESATEAASDQWIQCSRCQKWRLQVNGTVILSDEQDWFCTDNIDPLHDSCEAAEEEEQDIEATEEVGEELDIIR